MSTKMILEIETEETAADQLDFYITSAVGAHNAAQRLERLFQKLEAGALAGAVNIKTAAVQAQVLGTFTSFPANNDTIVINGVTFTAKTSGATGDQFNLGASATAAAANLVAAVNASATAGVKDVVILSNVAGVVTFKSKQAGKVGNAIVLSESLGNFTLAATVMSGGTQGSNTTHQFGMVPSTTY